MDLLFDSTGQHIATVVNRQLYNRRGTNIGQYLPQYGVFTDRHGRYLGEGVQHDRLLYNLMSPFCTTLFGAQRLTGARMRSPVDLEQRGPMRRMRGYIDLDPSLLGA